MATTFNLPTVYVIRVRKIPKDTGFTVWKVGDYAYREGDRFLKTGLNGATLFWDMKDAKKAARKHRKDHPKGPYFEILTLECRAVMNP